MDWNETVQIMLYADNWTNNKEFETAIDDYFESFAMRKRRFSIVYYHGQYQNAYFEVGPVKQIKASL